VARARDFLAAPKGRALGSSGKGKGKRRVLASRRVIPKRSPAACGFPIPLRKKKRNSGACTPPQGSGLAVRSRGGGEKLQAQSLGKGTPSMLPNEVVVPFQRKAPKQEISSFAKNFELSAQRSPLLRGRGKNPIATLLKWEVVFGTSKGISPQKEEKGESALERERWFSSAKNETAFLRERVEHSRGWTGRVDEHYDFSDPGGRIVVEAGGRGGGKKKKSICNSSPREQA